MAITKTINFKGLEIKNAYLKVWCFEGDKNEIRFGLGTYQAKGKGLIDSQQYSFPYLIEAGNPIKQAYDFLKTLEDFSDAGDC